MAVPRPLLIALVGAILAVAAFYASQAISAPASDAAASPEAPLSSQSPGAAAKPKPRPKPTTVGLPPRVQRALDAHKVLVLLFTQPGAADDDATRWASRALKNSRVAIFRDRISKIGDYKKAVESVNVSQAPAVVVIDRDLRARVLEGYTDRGTLRQVVRDAAR